MSFTFQLQKINHSFERIVSWYHEFMHRTELCFRSLHDRVAWLEQREARQGPSDEQVERVLRKILAEKFSNSVSSHGDAGAPPNSHAVKDPDYFVENPCPRPVFVDAATLVVDPEAVPSKVYLETIKMLEMRLADFPKTDLKDPQQQGVREARKI